MELSYSSDSEKFNFSFEGMFEFQLLRTDNFNSMENKRKIAI